MLRAAVVGLLATVVELLAALVGFVGPAWSC
jgi:hypothetical protein